MNKGKKVIFKQSGIDAALSKKPYINPGFKTGRYMTEKDRPRKKRWRKEDYDEYSR